MGLENAAFVLASIPYQIGMGYGLLALASFWAAPADKPRKIPQLLLLLFGVVIPLMGWFLSLFLPWFFFIVPGSLGYLYWTTVGAEKAQDKAGAAVLDEELEHAAKMIASDPDNAVGYWSMAKVYDQRGQWRTALENYRRANELSERTLSNQEWEDIRARLEHELSTEPGQSALTHGIIEKSLIVVGLAYLPWSGVLALNLCSVMLFILWYRGEPTRWKF